MRFDLTRLHGGDQTYAPGTFRAKNYLYWRAPKSYIDLGHTKAAVRLPGEIGDGRDLERAAKARELTRELLRWKDSLDVPKVQPGTWLWLIGRYKKDDISPFQDVKENTRENYLFHLSRWEEGIGAVEIAATDFPSIKRWQKAMEENGRSDHYIKAMFTMLRIIAGYGVALQVPGAMAVKAILGEIRFRSPKPRSVAPTEDQINAVIAAADAVGEHGFALGLSLQWWLSLRAVDVRGQHLGKGDGKRWADGLTWDMVDLDAMTIRKTPSKTARSAPEEIIWDLSLLPDIVERLSAIPKDRRIGPVVTMKNGKPYTRRGWADRFAVHRKAAGVPDIVKAMDTRAAAINHGKRAGASKIELQHAAVHASGSTTERYLRERGDAANKVIQLRRG